MDTVIVPVYVQIRTLFYDSSTKLTLHFATNFNQMYIDSIVKLEIKDQDRDWELNKTLHLYLSI